MCRRLGGLVVGGLVAGISVQLSAFFISWIALPSVVMTAAWIPWCLWAVLWVASIPLPSRGGVRGGLTAEGAGGQPPLSLPQAWGRELARSIAAVGACVGMMLLAGHLQIAAYGLLAVFAFVLWLVAFPVSTPQPPPHSPESRFRALWALAGLALGFAIAAPQLLPAIENGRQGHRAGAPTAEGWEAYRASAATPLELVTLVSPDFFGTPQPRNENTGMTSYWLAYEKPGRHYAEIAFYVGPVVLPLAAFALVGIRRRPQVGFFGVLALLGLFIALGTPVAQALYFGLPGWSATGSPGRAAVLVTLGLCVLAGMGLRELPQKEERRALQFSACTVAVVWLCFFLAVQLIPADIAAAFSEPRFIWLYLLFVPILGLGWTYFQPTTAGRLIFPLTAIVGVAPMVWIMAGEAGKAYDADFPGKKELQEAGRVAVIGDDWPFLTAPTKTIAPPNSLLQYGIKTVGGYDSIVSAKFKAKLDDANGQDSAPPANGNMMFVKPTADLLKLRRLGADAIMASNEFPFELPVIYNGSNWTLYKLEGETYQPFLFHESYNHRKLRWEGEYREISRKWLESDDADGWEMSPVTYDFTEKTVVAIYRPNSFRLGLLLGALGAACSIALSLWGAGHKNRTDGETAT